MPADSWPRCWSAYRPRYVTFAASAWFQIAKSPHSSWNLSSRHVALKTAPPCVCETIDREVDPLRARRDPDSIAARHADPAPRDRRLRHEGLELALARALDSDHDARGPLAEQHGVRARAAAQRDLAAD